MTVGRLIEKPAARAQLLAAIAALPAGEKLHLPRLRDCLVSQADIIGGIEGLIAAGLLDRVTLRPPVKAATLKAQPKSALLPAGQALATILRDEAERRGLSITAASRQIFGNASQLSMMRTGTSRPVQQKTFDRAKAWLESPPSVKAEPAPRRRPARSLDPGIQLPPPRVAAKVVSGEDLANEICAAIDANPAICKTAFGLRLFNCRNGVETLRRSKTVRPATIAKVRAILADPPLRQERPPRATPARRRQDPTKKPDTPLMDLADRQAVKGARRAADVQRTAERTATELVDTGVDPSTQNAMVAGKMREILRRREDEARLVDPVEVAKTVLRKRFPAVFDATVQGGLEGRFIISGLRDGAGKALQLTVDELIAKAREVDPRAMEAVQERASR